jgi:hypothetical protein
MPRGQIAHGDRARPGRDQGVAPVGPPGAIRLRAAPPC